VLRNRGCGFGQLRSIHGGTNIDVTTLLPERHLAVPSDKKRPVVLIVENELLIRMDAVDMVKAAGFDLQENLEDQTAENGLDPKWTSVDLNQPERCNPFARWVVACGRTEEEASFR
jgi:hypothetical protein